MFKKIMALTAMVLMVPVHAAVIEVGNLNIIDDPGNASDGLGYLDLSIAQGVGFTAAQALASAQAIYADARFATPSEFDDLFEAAGVLYDGALTAGDAFSTGPDSVFISTGTNWDPGLVLRDQLGFTIPGFASAIWTDPDGSEDPTTTYDFLFLFGTRLQLEHTVAIPEVEGNLSWLIVTELAPVPVPAAAWLFGSALIGMAGARRAKRSK